MALRTLVFIRYSDTISMENSDSPVKPGSVSIEFSAEEFMQISKSDLLAVNALPTDIFLKISDLIIRLINSTTISKVLLAVLTIIFLNSLLQNYFWPVSDWDALALYDFRGKVVAETGSFIDGIKLGYFYQYPPFTSLLHTTLYVLNFDRVKVWYSLLYVSFQIIF